MDISGKTKLYCLFGHPVAHSMSPAMHNAAFKSLGIDAVYLAGRIFQPHPQCSGTPGELAAECNLTSLSTLQAGEIAREQVPGSEFHQGPGRSQARGLVTVNFLAKQRKRGITI